APARAEHRIRVGADKPGRGGHRARSQGAVRHARGEGREPALHRPQESHSAGLAQVAETTQAIRSPFYKAHSELGATFMEEGGWRWTESFGDLEAEYRGVRDDLGVWDVSPLNKWSFRGRDALKAAALLHTSDVAGLEVGRIHYGAFCDNDGLMVDDGT